MTLYTWETSLCNKLPLYSDNAENSQQLDLT